MKRLLFVLPILGMLAMPASADFYVASDWNGWDAGSNVMNDLGGGLWDMDVTLGASEKHEFKITQGDWTWAVPGSGNSFLFTDGAGAATITLDENLYSDGWLPDQYRIGVNDDPGAWTAVGDWQGWDNANAGTAMASLGGGIYYYEQTISLGWHEYKAVRTGSWDGIGTDGRSVNASTYWFECTAGNDLVQMWVNADDGTMKIDVVPEPATLAALLLGLALIRRR